MMAGIVFDEKGNALKIIKSGEELKDIKNWEYVITDTRAYEVLREWEERSAT